MFLLSFFAIILLVSNFGQYDSALVCEAENEHYSDIVSGCPQTCNNLHAPICHSIILRPSCICNDGFVIDTVNHKCVLPENCPQISIAEEPVLQEQLVCAAENEVYAESRSGCPQTCQNTHVLERCQVMSMSIIVEPSCVCVTGTIKDNVSGRCVAPINCPV